MKSFKLGQEVWFIITSYVNGRKQDIQLSLDVATFILTDGNLAVTVSQQNLVFLPIEDLHGVREYARHAMELKASDLRVKGKQVTTYYGK